MKSTIDTRKFGAVLERHLPPLEEIYDAVCRAGFRAWKIFIEERLSLVDGSVRDTELRTLLLSCREEFCNFARYTRQSGGDGLRLPELEAMRQRAKNGPPEQGYLLFSDTLMRTNLSLTRKYVSATKEKVSAQLLAERSRYLEYATSITTARLQESISNRAIFLLRELFGKAGFTTRESLRRTAFFEKVIGPTVIVFAYLEEVELVGRADWRGEIPLSFYLKLDGALTDSFVDTRSKGIRGLPLRIAGLAPGVDSYTNGGYFLPTSSLTVGDRDVVVLAVYDKYPISPQDEAVVLAHLALAVDCHLAFFRAIESSLSAACIEYRKIC